MFNKKVVFGLLASFVLVAPVNAQEVQAGQIDQVVKSDTTAVGNSVSVTSTDQKAYLDQYNDHRYGPGVQAGNINQFADVDTTAIGGSLSVTETNQEAYLDQELDKKYYNYYGY